MPQTFNQEKGSLQPFVCLVAMPWPVVSEPSLGLGILKSQLGHEKVNARVYHAYLDLLRHVTFETYTFVSGCCGINEFLFTFLIDPKPDARQLLRLVEETTRRIKTQHRIHSKYSDSRSLAGLFWTLREEVIPNYLVECAQVILSHKPTMVGFTCLSDQTIASIALARVIKDMDPHVLIALGGSALNGPPGRNVINTFPWIDCIAWGDGEKIVGQLAQASVGKRDLCSIEGIRSRTTEPSLPLRVGLESSPTPDYDDWFSDLANLRKFAEVEVRTTVLPVEGSRGCWYGQAHHCVFCGIDDVTLHYRSKSPEQVFEMLAALREKYGDHDFRFNDYILSNRYYKTLLPKLVNVHPPYRLQCEIKANQTASRIKLFRNSGFTDLQPGIESFSTPVLKLMNKGVRAIQNVSTLKLGYVNGLVIHYNILFGLPGEVPEHYQNMLKSIPRLYHLQPPLACSEIEVTRASPLQAAYQEFGILDKPRHAWVYEVLFSETFLERTGFDLDEYAYYFERPFQYSDGLAELYEQVSIQVNHWKALHRERDVTLAYSDNHNGLTFTDSRFGEGRSVPLGDIEASIYLACDAEPTDISHIATATGCNVQEVELVLEFLDHERLVWREDEKVLGLGVPISIVESHRALRWKRAWMSLHNSSLKGQDK